MDYKELFKPIAEVGMKKCEECGEDTSDQPDGYDHYCMECCEHGDTHKGHCLDCSKDLREDIMAAAYDRAKDFRKYGE